MPAKILCVDDEANVLKGIQRSLRKQYDLVTALSGADALQLLESDHSFAVVVSDMRMPGMDGVQLLSAVKTKSPDSTRIMLTGNADQQTAIDAINQGNIFRFLTKPCPPEQLVQTLEAGIHQHRLVTAEKELLGKTLRGSIKVLSDVLALVNPAAFGPTTRIQKLVKKVADELGVGNDWSIDMAAMLSQIGCVTVPQEIFEKVYQGERLVGREREMFEAHPSVAKKLVEHIPRLEKVAHIIAYQEKNYDGSGVPDDDVRETEIPLASRILRIVRDYDILTWQGQAPTVAFQELRNREGFYDSEILNALAKVSGYNDTLVIGEVSLKELKEGMILAENLCTTCGVVLAAKGMDITIALKQRLANFSRNKSIQEPVSVRMPAR
jgi:response regulator RpfG family c-di-GMP phosphodiesterase